jgi:hypothetical protein
MPAILVTAEPLTIPSISGLASPFPSQIRDRNISQSRKRFSASATVTTVTMSVAITITRLVLAPGGGQGKPLVVLLTPSSIDLASRRSPCRRLTVRCHSLASQSGEGTSTSVTVMNGARYAHPGSARARSALCSGRHDGEARAAECAPPLRPMAAQAVGRNADRSGGLAGSASSRMPMRCGGALWNRGLRTRRSSSHSHSPTCDHRSKM